MKTVVYPNASNSVIAKSTQIAEMRNISGKVFIVPKCPLLL